MSNYIGKYLNSAQEGKEGYQIDIVLDDGKFCYDSKGNKFSYMDLDYTYERIQAPMYSPEVMKELRAMGGNENIFVGAKKPNVDQVVNQSVVHQQKTNHPPVQIVEQNNKEIIQIVSHSQQSSQEITHYGSQDLQNFIAIAVKNSRKKNQTSKLTITLDIDFDFDVEKVIGSAAEICESEKDKDIISEVLNYSDLEMEKIKAKIAETLLKSE